jgi:hypothetical protein
MFNGFEASLMRALHFPELCPAVWNRFPPAKTGLCDRRRANGARTRSASPSALAPKRSVDPQLYRKSTTLGQASWEIYCRPGLTSSFPGAISPEIFTNFRESF